MSRALAGREGKCEPCCGMPVPKPRSVCIPRDPLLCLSAQQTMGSPSEGEAGMNAQRLLCSAGMLFLSELLELHPPAEDGFCHSAGSLGCGERGLTKISHKGGAGASLHEHPLRRTQRCAADWKPRAAGQQPGVRRLTGHVTI